MNLLTENDINSVPVSKLEETPYYNPSLFINYFPDSPQMHLEYEHVYLQFLETFHQQNQSIITNTTMTTTPSDANTTISDLDINNINMFEAEYSKTNAKVREEEVAVIKKMRPSNESTTRNSKKDRHSKINTAHGPRDRRMRLSLEVARKFFDLQDLLGFDKPSKTVDWLLKNSSDAIRELTVDGNSCEVVSSITTTSEEYFAYSNYSSSSFANHKALSEGETTRVNSSSAEDNMGKRKIRKKNEKKKIRLARRREISVEKESRRQARERARERTSQKRWLSEIITRTNCDINDHREQIRPCTNGDEINIVLSSAGGKRVRVYDNLFATAYLPVSSAKYADVN